MTEDAPKQQVVTVKDAREREIEIRRLKPIDRLRMLEIIGAENASNGPYLGYATLAYSVTKIDGQDRPRITSKVALESIVTLLDEDGLNAVAEGFKQLYPDAAAQDQETLKNE